MILPPALDLVDIGEEHVLVVDDVADTGETLRLVADTVRPAVNVAFETAVLYEKPRSVVRPGTTCGGAPTAGSRSPGAPTRRCCRASQPEADSRRTCGRERLPRAWTGMRRYSG